MFWNDSDYELKWPPGLLKKELIREIGCYEKRRHYFKMDNEAVCRVQNILEDAFSTSVPLSEFNSLVSGPAVGKMLETGGVVGVSEVSEEPYMWLSELIENADSLPVYAISRPYFSIRKKQELPCGPNYESCVRNFCQLVDDFLYIGYLPDLSEWSCVDEVSLETGETPYEVVKRVYPYADIWPIDSSILESDRTLFLDTVEVVYDFSKAPRTKRYHDFSDCGWHYSDYSKGRGQSVYIWRVNLIFEAANIPYRMSEAGADRGRIVEVFDEGRQELIDRVSQGELNSERREIQHAISSFRKRGATREDKRSACLGLSRVTEKNREKIETILSKGQNRALFEFVNKFDIRHSKSDQVENYPVEFMDWYFWTALATVELVSSLLGYEEHSDLEIAYANARSGVM
ncbi:hypothetical protein M0E84_05450 [Corynebacterium sp. CCM 9186]|uniref:hypothetical protein n=1 Tax=Corynebacterium meridianum TaxID=2765363 RepID=UPI002004FA97|nr:hypothetical protein [Corynebacterium meridianum]MCK7677483.1 hypothetical protein [Corynebacterium meridianum]